jgi:hypothetical protein
MLLSLQRLVVVVEQLLDRIIGCEYHWQRAWFLFWGMGKSLLAYHARCHNVQLFANVGMYVHIVLSAALLHLYVQMYVCNKNIQGTRLSMYSVCQDLHMCIPRQIVHTSTHLHSGSLCTVVRQLSNLMSVLARLIGC